MWFVCRIILFYSWNSLLYSQHSLNSLHFLTRNSICFCWSYYLTGIRRLSSLLWRIWFVVLQLQLHFGKTFIITWSLTNGLAPYLYIQNNYTLDYIYHCALSPIHTLTIIADWGFSNARWLYPFSDKFSTHAFQYSIVLINIFFNNIYQALSIFNK